MHTLLSNFSLFLNIIFLPKKKKVTEMDLDEVN